MVNKGIFCAILSAILLILVITVQIKVDTFLCDIKENVQKIDDVILLDTQINTLEIKNLVNDLNDYWENNIGTISFIINYNEISSVGESISRLKAGIEANDFVSSNTEVELLLRILTALQKVLGVRLPNLL